jgi:hypothetical protein
MHADKDDDERSRSETCVAARAAVELRADRALTDAEWAAAHARLLEYAGILRVWDRKTTVSRRCNVE